MKIKILSTILISIICLLGCSLLSQRMTVEQYYGQKPPGSIPELYHPDFSFLQGADITNLAFSPDGKEMCYMVEDTTSKERHDKFSIYYVKMENGKWLKPQIAWFVANEGKGAMPQFSPDGKRFSYTYKGDLWTSIKKSGQWSSAEKYPEPINTEKYECDFALVKGDRFYFAANGRPDGKSNQCDIYCVKMNNGKPGPAINQDNLNTERSECVLAVEPDEKYIIFTCYFNKSGNDAVDLFISFQKKDATWTVAQRLDSLFNSPGSNHSPKFSCDGKYFFFSQTNRTDANTIEIKNYWVSTMPFDKMRQDELKKMENN